MVESGHWSLGVRPDRHDARVPVIRDRVVHAGPRLRAVAVTIAPALPAALVAWLVAAAALRPNHALTGVHSYAGTGYDDGVYLGAAVRLLHGSLPWLDFDLLHPPGAVWLGLPFAALGELTDASTGLAAARIATVVVAGLNTVLAGYVVRSRGPLAVFVAAMLLALMPTSYGATQTLLLEPYLVLLSLAGLVLLARADGRPASGARLVAAGALVGAATSVKVFGMLVALGVLLALLPRGRAMRDWSIGVLAGGALLTLPLVLAAPGRAVRDIVLVNLFRDDLDRGVGLADRLPVVLGLSALPDPAASARAVVVLIAVVLVVAAGVVVELRRGRLTRLHTATVVVAVVAFAGMLQPRQFFDHYAYFLVALLVLPVALGVAAVVDALAVVVRRARPALAVVAALVVAAVLLVPGALARSADYTAESADPGPLIRRYVPSGSCVATDLPTVVLVADRMGAPRSCDVPLDPYGVWFAENDYVPAHTPPPYRPAFVDRWREWFERADYVVLSVELSDFVPWTPDLIAWFEDHYVLVGSGPRTFVYVRLPA